MVSCFSKTLENIIGVNCDSENSLWVVNVISFLLTRAFLTRYSFSNFRFNFERMHWHQICLQASRLCLFRLLFLFIYSPQSKSWSRSEICTMLEQKLYLVPCLEHSAAYLYFANTLPENNINYEMLPTKLMKSHSDSFTVGDATSFCQVCSIYMF